jgi:hypothetical protein
MLETAWMIERGRALPINGKASSKIGAAVPVGKIRPVLTLAGEPHHVVAALAAGSAGDQRDLLLEPRHVCPFIPYERRWARNSSQDGAVSLACFQHVRQGAELSVAVFSKVEPGLDLHRRALRPCGACPGCGQALNRALRPYRSSAEQNSLVHIQRHA